RTATTSPHADRSAATNSPKQQQNRRADAETPNPHGSQATDFRFPLPQPSTGHRKRNRKPIKKPAHQATKKRDHAYLRSVQLLLFHPHALLGACDRALMVAGEGFHPVLIDGCTLAEDLLADYRYPDHWTEEVHDLLGS